LAEATSRELKAMSESRPLRSVNYIGQAIAVIYAIADAAAAMPHPTKTGWIARSATTKSQSRAQSLHRQDDLLMNRFCLALLALVLLNPFVQAEKPFFAEPFLLGVHRGGAKWRPEHTVDTYLEAAKRWPNALLEMDVRLTKDAVVVLQHDAKVDRTTDGEGPIEEMTLAEVQALDAGYDFTPDDGETFPYRGKGLRIATLDEVLTALPKARWLIEPKTDGPLVAAMAKVVKDHDAAERVLIASFQPAVVAEIKTLMPSAPTCFTMTSGMKLFGALRAGGEAWDSYQPDDDVLSISRGMVKQYKLTAEEFKQVQAKGVKVQLHTLDSEEELRAGIAMGVDSILSDRPDVFEKVLKEK
jgi:glycerophosphoryl diester phosphodiesterase